MSLTSQLSNAASPVSQFFRSRLSNSKSFLSKARKQVRAQRTIRPEGNLPWTTIGTALDYRIRYYFDVTPPEKLAAFEGARELGVAQLPAPAVGTLGIHRAQDRFIFFDKETGRRLGKYIPALESAVGESGVSSSDVAEFARLGHKAAAGHLVDDRLEGTMPSPLTQPYRELL